jgi:soluble P-type ATPase
VTGRSYEIPGAESIALDHLLLDVNGTLTDSGKLISGVTERLRRIARDLDVHMLSADSFGTLDALSAQLGIEGRRVSSGREKRDLAAGSEPRAARRSATA